MSAQHTPGPWSVYTSELGRHEGRINAACGSIAELYPVTKGDWRANAALIAAAPELLEACKSAEEDLTCYQTESIEWLTVERVAELLDQLREAIARATK